MSAIKIDKNWHDSILKLKLPQKSHKENLQYCNLVDMAENTEDIEVVKTLFLTIPDDDTGGVEQTLYGVLSTVGYLIYYQAYCDILEEIIEIAPNATGQCLVHTAKEFSPQEVKQISDFIRARISDNLRKKLVAVVRKYQIGEWTDNYPYNLFLEYLAAANKDQNHGPI